MRKQSFGIYARRIRIEFVSKNASLRRKKMAMYDLEPRVPFFKLNRWLLSSQLVVLTHSKNYHQLLDCHSARTVTEQCDIRNLFSLCLFCLDCRSQLRLAVVCSATDTNSSSSSLSVEAHHKNLWKIGNKEEKFYYVNSRLH